MTHARTERTARSTAQAQDRDTWNSSNDSGLSSDGAQNFFLGYHNEQSAVNAAFKHITQDGGRNPNAVQQDLLALSDAAAHPGQGGNSDWRLHFLHDLQDKINGNSAESKAIRKAYGLPDDQKFSFSDNGNTLNIPPAPFNPTRSSPSQLPGARPGDVSVSSPRQGPDGYDSTGYAQDANGKQSFYREHDYVQNGIPTKSVRNFEQPTDLKRGDTVIAGVNSEITTRNNDNSAEVTLNTAKGQVSYHLTPDGKVQFNPPTGDQLGAQKPGSPLLPTGSYSENSSHPMTPSPDNPNISTGWLGGDLNPFGGNFNNIAVTSEKHVDSNGRIDTMSVSYEHKMGFGAVSFGGGADLSGQQVYANRNATSPSSVNWNNVRRIDYTWDSSKGAYKMNVIGGDGSHAFWTDGKRIFQDW